MVRAEKIVSDSSLQFLISTFVSYTRPVTVKPFRVRFWKPIVAEEAAELTAILPEITTGRGELVGPLR
jgi:hypothetical protein